jgi:hypothetical protein
MFVQGKLKLEGMRDKGEGLSVVVSTEGGDERRGRRGKGLIRGN